MTPMQDEAELVLAVSELLPRAPLGRPFLLSITGIPGSGKSTLAQRVVAAANSLQGSYGGSAIAITLPMDGFHYSNTELEAKGLRDRKGAPETFDVVGLLGTIQAIHREDFPIPFPIYDREQHEPVLRDDPSQLITPDLRLVVVEGNYLLLDEEPWRLLHALWDERWFLHCPWAVAEQRLLDRHLAGGKPRDVAVDHIARVDQANAERIEQTMLAYDVKIGTGGE